MKKVVFSTIATNSLFFVALLLLTLNLSGCGGLYFYPKRKLLSSPEDFKLAYHDVWIKTEDEERLHGWYLPAKGEPKASVLHLHGNAENISTHIFNVYWLPKHGYDVLTFDYRGFGQSSGTASLPEVVMDAQAALAYLRGLNSNNPQCTIVIGQSIGGAIAILALAELAADQVGQSAVEALVLDSTFADFYEIAENSLKSSWIFSPLQPLLPILLPKIAAPEKMLTRLGQTPILVIHGEADSIVPLGNAERLYKSAPAEKEYWVIPEGKHIDALSRPGVRSELLDYFDERCAAGFSMVSAR